MCYYINLPLLLILNEKKILDELIEINLELFVFQFVAPFGKAPAPNMSLEIFLQTMWISFQRLWRPTMLCPQLLHLLVHKDITVGARVMFFMWGLPTHPMETTAMMFLPSPVEI